MNNLLKLFISASLAFTPTTDNLPDFYSTVLNNSFQWGQEGWGGHVAVGLLTICIFLFCLVTD